MKLVHFNLKRSNNLHFIRFIAAIGVVLSHAFALGEGTEINEWAAVITDNSFTMGGISVTVFFLFAGYLIAKSTERVKKGVPYFKQRLIRILPPLIFVTLCVMILGVFFTSLSAAEYFASGNTYKYLLNGVFVLVHELPGVFSQNVYNATVNGALWTLPVEMLCYVACFIVYKITLFNKKRFGILLPIALLGFIGAWFAGEMFFAPLSAMVRPCAMFLLGMAFWVYRDNIVLDGKIALIALAGLILSIVFKVSNIGLCVFFPYIVFYLSFCKKQCNDFLGNLGCYAYGIYLWGFPIQQAVVQLFGGQMNPYLNFAISAPISILLGILTYFVAEENSVLRKIRAKI